LYSTTVICRQHETPSAFDASKLECKGEKSRKHSRQVLDQAQPRKESHRMDKRLQWQPRETSRGRQSARKRLNDCRLNIREQVIGLARLLLADAHGSEGGRDAVRRLAPGQNACRPRQTKQLESPLLAASSPIPSAHSPDLL